MNIRSTWDRQKADRNRQEHEGVALEETAHERDTLKSHYEFDYSKAKPNRFAARLTEDSLMVVLKPADESFRQGWQEALQGETLPIAGLWTGIEA